MKAASKYMVAVVVLGIVLASVGPALAQQRVVVEERTAVVLKMVGTTVIIRNDKGEVKQFSNVPEGAVLYVNGKPAKLVDLREGMRIQALRFQDVPPPTIISESEAEQMGLPTTPAPAATEPMAAAPPTEAAPEAAASAPAKAPELPPTGSAWPLLGLIGAVLVLAGLALGTAGRRARA